MGTVGAAVGMLLALAGMVIALWELPGFRRAVLSDGYGMMFAFGAAMLAGGWGGYRLFVTLFAGA